MFVNVNVSVSICVCTQFVTSASPPGFGEAAGKVTIPVMIMLVVMCSVAVVCGI